MRVVDIQLEIVLFQETNGYLKRFFHATSTSPHSCFTVTAALPAVECDLQSLAKFRSCLVDVDKTVLEYKEFSIVRERRVSSYSRLHNACKALTVSLTNSTESKHGGGRK
jgi:hypothetical protein